jgi:threonine dehydrogenase-like Zn-dependent dehydrogenase
LWLFATNKPRACTTIRKKTALFIRVLRELPSRRYNAVVLSFRIEKGKLKAISSSVSKLRPGWALIRVRLVGICNTDVELLHGYYDFRGVPGHEFVGTVEEVLGVSAAEKKKWMGQRVCGEINISCRALGRRPVCDFCRRGLKAHCARRTVLGIIGHPGAYAEFLTLPLENLHVVPDGVRDEQAVFVEPLAAACEILEQVDVRRIREAAVLGDGKLAQLIARVLRTAIPRVVIYGKHEKKLALARRAGIAAKKVRGDASDLKRVAEKYRLVVEATGSPTGLGLAQQMTEPRGTLVLKSTFHGAAPAETWPIVVNEITVVGSRCGPFAKAIALLRSGKIDPTPLITRMFPLADSPSAIGFAQEPGAMKVLLKPKTRTELTQSSQRAQWSQRRATGG